MPAAVSEPGVGPRIEALGPVLGAEILELDITRPIGAEAAARLDAALTDFGVLLVRRQPLDAKGLVAFARSFGPLRPHVQRAYRHPDEPDVVIMTNRKADGSFNEAGARRGAIEITKDGWHSDLSYDPVPAKATLLHAVAIPSSGGNTCFSDATRAYRALEPELRRRLRGLEAEFPYGGHSRNPATAMAASTLDAEAQATARAIHPVITAHPVTGAPGIYANPLVTSRILGLEDDESEAIIEALAEALDGEEFRWEHVWSVGDTLIWDNRGGTMHTGRLDYPRDQERSFIRTTVSGGPTTAYLGEGAEL